MRLRWPSERLAFYFALMFLTGISIGIVGPRIGQKLPLMMSGAVMPATSSTPDKPAP